MFEGAALFKFTYGFKLFSTIQNNIKRCKSLLYNLKENVQNYPDNNNIGYSCFDKLFPLFFNLK